MRKGGLAAAGVAALAAGWVGAPAASGAPAGSAANPVRASSISGPGFAPARIAVRRGAVVSFRSVDGAGHDATSVRRVRGRRLFTSGAPGTRFRIGAPRAAGSYAFLCTVHPSMRGTLVVR